MLVGINYYDGVDVDVHSLEKSDWDLIFMFDIKKCEVFIAIEKTKNLTKAATLLGYTQPGISNIVRSMEEEVGFPLFYRTHQGVMLTSEANRLLPEIKTILTCMKSLEQTVDNINGIKAGHVSIGSYSSTSMLFLSKWIERFSKLYPNITFSIIEGGTSELEEALNTFKVDIAIMSKQSHHTYSWIPLIEDPICAVLPLDFHYQEKSFRVSDYDQMPLIYHEKGLDVDVDHVIDYMKNNNITPIYKYCMSFDRTMMSMIEHHLGIGIIPELITKYFFGNLKILPLEPPFKRELGIASLSEIPLSPVARLFVEYCQKNI